MGYDYRTATSSPVGSVAPLSRTGYDVVDTVVAYTLADLAVEGDPRRPVLRPGLVDRRRAPSTRRTRARSGPAPRRASPTTPPPATSPSTAASTTPTEGVAWTAYRRQNCTSTYGCVTSWRQLYVDDATAIRRKYDLVNPTACAGPGSGRSATTGRGPSCGPRSRRSSSPTPPRRPSASGRCRRPRRTRASRWPGPAPTTSAIAALRRPGLGRRRRVAAWLTGDEGRVGRLVRRRRPRLCVPRPCPRRPKGNWSAWNVASHVAAPPAALAVGGFGTVRVDGLAVRAAAGHLGAAARQPVGSGNLVAIVGGPRSRRRLDVVPGRRAALRVGRDPPAAPRLGRRSGPAAELVAGEGPRTRPASRPRSAASASATPARRASA